MRIEAYNQIASLYQTGKAGKTAGNSAPGARDQVQISQTGRDFQIAKQAVELSPDIREDKVAQLKSKVESGQYDLNPNDFAAKLLQQYNSYF